MNNKTGYRPLKISDNTLCQNIYFALLPLIFANNSRMNYNTPRCLIPLL